MAQLSSSLKSNILRCYFLRNFCNRQLKFDDSLPAPSSTPAIDSDRESFSLSSLIRSLDGNDRRRLEDCLIEYHLFGNSGSTRIPSHLSAKDLRRLIPMKTKRERILYMTYLYDKERSKAEERRLNKEKKEELAKRRAEFDHGPGRHIWYGMNGSAILRHVCKSDMNNYYDSRLAKALMFGPRLIIDTSMIPLLRSAEWAPTGRQLVMAYHHNRMHRFPHHLVYTGCTREHEAWEYVERFFTNGIDSCMVTVTEDHYLDLFPKEQLVYLSPDAERTMNEYDHEKTYIVGALADKFGRPHLTKRVAEQQGIETRKLPLKEIKYHGRAALCMYHLVAILNDACVDGNLLQAIKKTLATIDENREAHAMRKELKTQRYFEYLKLDERFSYE